MKQIILSTLGAVVLLLSGLASSASASTIFTLDQDGCSGGGGCGGGPFGTVALEQTTSDLVTVTLTLVAGEHFVNTGAGDALQFNVADAGLIISNISPGFAVGPANDKASTFGSFLESITCSSCQGGNKTNPTGPLTFTATSPTGVTIADFVANSGGYYFVSDLLALNGKSGNVAAMNSDPVNPTPEPASLALLGLGFSGVALIRKRVRK